MTRKHYELIALAIKTALAEAGGKPVLSAGIRLTAENIAEKLQYDNPNFSKHRFMKACGLGD